MIGLHLQHDASEIWVGPDILAVSEYNGGSRLWLASGAVLHVLETPVEVLTALHSRYGPPAPETKEDDHV